MRQKDNASRPSLSSVATTLVLIADRQIAQIVQFHRHRHQNLQGTHSLLAMTSNVEQRCIVTMEEFFKHFMEQVGIWVTHVAKRAKDVKELLVQAGTTVETTVQQTLEEDVNSPHKKIIQRQGTYF